MPLEQPPKRVLILGGGTAGWMAAIMMAHAWQSRGVEITLMESATIGTIGVGEGSTPRMRAFFENLGIPESEWMPACNATYKCGIRFPGWSTRPGYQSYYHPFFTLSDKEFAQTFFHNAQLRQSRKADVHAHPDAFFVSQHLARERRAPLADASTQYQTDYAYHFDAARIGAFLKERSQAMGVRHVVDTVTAVNRREDGDIASVDTEANGTVAADFFVDCTGFAGLLIGRTLDVPFQSYADHLFNDRAVALPTALPDGPLPSETLSTALNYGWAWKIPLTNRFGNGYVYSSAYCTPEDAEAELRAHTGQHDPSVEARHLQMRVGRRERSWQGNCLAVGLAQGFIEPLEATALMLVQDTLERFIDCVGDNGASQRDQDVFNDRIGRTFDGVRDYVFMHYKLNTRADSQYWIDCRENAPCSDLVAELLDVWDKGGDILAALSANSDQLVYSHTSWVCILAGMGRFPGHARKPKRNQQYADPALVREHCRALLPHFPDHRRVIEDMGRSAA